MYCDIYVTHSLHNLVIFPKTICNIFNCFEDTGFEKDTIKGYAHRTSQEEAEVKYESNFEVPIDFGPIGAVFVENEHHKEMYLQDIILNGFPNGPVRVKCKSWAHSKYDNPQKRAFFANKVHFSLSPISIFYMHIYTNI